MSEERKAAERMLFRLLMVILILVIGVWLVPQVWDKFSPFLIAVPIAAMLQPVVLWLQKKLKMKPGIASLIPVLLLLALVLVLFWWLLSFGIDQLSYLVNHSPEIVNETVTSIREATNNFLKNVGQNFSPDAQQWFRNSMNTLVNEVTQWGATLASRALSFSVNLAAALPYSLVYLSFVCMGLYFVSKDYANIRSYLPGGAKRKQDSSTTELTNSAIKSLVAYLKVQCSFAAMVMVISFIYLTCFRFQYAGMIALVAGIMEMIPMVGNGLLYVVLGVSALLDGNTAVGIQVLALTGGLQLLRRLLEPKIVSNSIGITPLESLIGMFAGMRMGGILGLIGGPVLMSVLVGSVRGRRFESFLEDGKLIVQYFRRRWARNKPDSQPPEPQPETQS